MALDKQQAVELTEKIKSNLDENARLIKRAVDGKIWIALKYSGFSEWLTEAVGISRSRGYQLLNVAKLEEDLKSSISLPEHYIISDLNTRAVMKHGREKFLAAVKAGATDDEIENAVFVEKLISEIRGELEAPVAPSIEVDPAAFADSFFQQFAASVRDLPTVDELDPADYDSVLTEMKSSLDHIDRAVSSYQNYLESGASE